MRRICKWRGCVLAVQPGKELCPSHEKARRYHGHIVLDSPFQGFLPTVRAPVTIKFRVGGELVSFTV